MTLPTFAAFRRAMFRWDVALAVCCIIAFIALAVILTGCSDAPTAPSYRTSCESDCRETVAAPLSPSETQHWMQRARDEVQASADRGEIKLSRPLSSLSDPSVDWRPCPWTCSNCYDTPGGSGQRLCAAGQTSSDGKMIYISTWQRDRRGTLVQWEARNSLWIRTGNGRLAYAAVMPEEGLSTRILSERTY